MDIVRYILFAQVFVAFFVAGGVFFKTKNLRSLTLSLLIALVGFHIVLFLFGSGKLVNVYPQFRSWFYYEIAFLFGPLVFVHLQCLIVNKKKIRILDVLHLIPIVVFWLGYGDVLLMEGNVRSAYIEANFLSRTMFWNYVLAFQTLLYAVGSSIYLFFNQSKLSANRLQYALFLVVAYVCSSILISYLTYYANSWRDFAWYYVALTFLIFGVGYFLVKNPLFLVQIKKKYFGSNLSNNDMKRIRSKIEKAFINDKVFLKGNFNISELSAMLNEKPHHVSQTFSELISENFNDYVNKHRIEIAKQYLHDSKYKNYKIEAIALESGFNNKVTFYKAFTKFTGQKPSAFRKSKK
ncbi:helix-turn-helix domain-containing protein [Winogradskyella litoriviva]|uniref:Helix-turn-helix domain-containing protein n=1 Tax=Winogradskyella litoriviva TaxID=1220182 RepID=A0ABX2EB14_9FLAO|nr:helix-turn-helix domain-containing protein [Winogradskyella litoriviva]NRD24832.1 helix-turn-helix domain-containing protein [Winogradskyella litoriviva]